MESCYKNFSTLKIFITKFTCIRIFRFPVYVMWVCISNVDINARRTLEVWWCVWMPCLVCHERSLLGLASGIL